VQFRVETVTIAGRCYLTYLGVHFGVAAAPNAGCLYLSELWVQSDAETAPIVVCSRNCTQLWVLCRVETAPMAVLTPH
jgi:hypothetical protein